MSTEKNNLLIAEFMGLQVRTYTDAGTSFNPDKRWELLMPVVEFILGLDIDEGRFYNRFCEEMASGSGIDGVYATVIEAIEYINENE